MPQTPTTSTHSPRLTRLHHELTTAHPSTDPQTLPYLRAVIREALRTSMANPTRLPRVVPPQGWSFASHHFPPGTSVGCAAHTLHFNPDVYSDPYEFKPERWLDDVTMEMNRDHFAFGLGTRTCIARNLAMAELFEGTRGVVVSGVLEGARTVVERIEIDEWFNSKVKDEMIMLVWG